MTASVSTYLYERLMRKGVGVMWFIQPKTNYIPEMPWERVDEPECMSWQVRVRDYNTLGANGLFFFMLFFMFGGASALVFLAEGGSKEVDISLFVLAFLLIPVVMSMTHQTSIIVYRLTDKGYEKISWKPQIDSVKPVLKWTAIVSGIAVFIGALYHPAILMGMVGPAGMGLMALGMGGSKGYQDLVRAEDHMNFSWEEVDELVLWRKRNLIGARTHFSHDDGRAYDAYMTLYCRNGEVEEVLRTIRDVIPSVPCNERKLEVFEGAAFLPEDQEPR